MPLSEVPLLSKECLRISKSTAVVGQRSSSGSQTRLTEANRNEIGWACLTYAQEACEKFKRNWPPGSTFVFFTWVKDSVTQFFAHAHDIHTIWQNYSFWATCRTTTVNQIVCYIQLFNFASTLSGYVTPFLIYTFFSLSLWQDMSVYVRCFVKSLHIPKFSEFSCKQACNICSLYWSSATEQISSGLCPSFYLHMAGVCPPVSFLLHYCHSGTSISVCASNTIQQSFPASIFCSHHAPLFICLPQLS